MLSLGGSRDEISVVSDQRGAPSNALDIADGIFNVARNLIARPDDDVIRGVFHRKGGGNKMGGIRDGDFRRLRGE